MPLADKIAVVSGASRGIGRAVALKLAERGAHVIAIARTEGGLMELDDEIRAAGGSATLVPLDLRDFAAIDRLGGTIFERWQRLDIMIANAGVLGPLSPLGHIKPERFDEVVDVNITAVWRMIRSFDPLLRQSQAARGVFVTSGAVQKMRPFWGAYSMSKAALNAMAVTYARELEKTPHRMNLFSPGPTRTKMREAAMPGEDPDTLPLPEAIAEKMMPLVMPDLAVTGKIYDVTAGGFVDP